MKLALLVLVAACGSGGESPITFGASGSLGAGGKGSFRFGVASAATQIEDMNPATDWYLWSRPVAQGGLGNGAAFVGDATRGYSKVLEDLALVKSLGVDSYRFSIEWARIEPVKDQIDETALAHYRTQLETMKSMGIKPIVTLHHFSNPVWVMDPREPTCAGGPIATNLCGFGRENHIVTRTDIYIIIHHRSMADLISRFRQETANGLEPGQGVVRSGFQVRSIGNAEDWFLRFGKRLVPILI